MLSPKLKWISLFAISGLYVLWIYTRVNTVGYASTFTETSTATPLTASFTPSAASATPIPETATASPTPTPEENPPISPISSSRILFPLVVRQPLVTPMPPGIIRICNYNAISIPDGDPAGVNSQINIGDPRIIQDLDIQLDIEHPIIGDLSVALTQAISGKSSLLIDRPIDPNTVDHKKCKLSDIKGILDDEISASVQDQCAGSPAAVSGIYVPNQPLNVFKNEYVAGTWTLNVADNNAGYTGVLKSWCLVARVGEPIQITPTPQPPQLPLQAFVYGVTGQNQAMPLDCEARVAVDYANFFGVHINEYTFFNNLPTSDNPDAGFVGNVYGAWGQIPPNAYGVHADPVADLLRAYGVVAYAHRPLSWDDLRAEITAGKPVFVWVIGKADYNEIPVYYTSNDGHMSIVAHYEHVVMVKGYTENTVTIQNGSSTYTLGIQTFLSSWSALDNMAITTRP